MSTLSFSFDKASKSGILLYMADINKLTAEEFEQLVENRLADGEFLNMINGYFEGILTKDNDEDLVIEYLLTEYEVE